MAFVTPPTFSDSAVLTATQLNQLSSSVNSLQSAANQPTPGFLMVAVEDDGTRYFWMRHAAANDYLHFRITQADPDSVDVYITPDGDSEVHVWDDGAPPSGTTEYVLRLSTGDATEDGGATGATTLSVTLDDLQFYTIKVVLGVASGNSTIESIEERSTA